MSQPERPSARPIPVVVVSSIDPVLREAVTAGLLCDLPGAVAVRHDVLPDPGRLRRVVVDAGGLRQDGTEPLAHPCLSCALAVDIERAVAELAPGRPDALVLALPVSADPRPIVRALRSSSAPVTISTSLAALDPAALEADVFGDDLLDERGLALGATDRRAVGEALVRQLESADLLSLLTWPPELAAAQLDHLVGADAARVPLHELDGRRLLTRRRADSWSRRGDLRLAAHPGAADRPGLWTVDLRSWKAFHPDRLLEKLEQLGAGPLRGRGYFWLPTRPGLQCAWDGAGGQLSIGPLESWRSAPATRLVITGVGPARGDLVAAFEEALLTDRELSAGLEHWLDRDDSWNVWLGPRADAVGGNLLGEAGR